MNKKLSGNSAPEERKMMLARTNLIRGFAMYYTRSRRIARRMQYETFISDFKLENSCGHIL